MNFLTMRAALGAITAVVAAVTVAMSGPSSVVLGSAAAIVAASLVAVALATQLRDLRESERLVYRPVYVRRQPVQRRVRSED